MLFRDDLSFPDMLVAKALRANVPHGFVKKVDTSKAEKMPGIVKILTAKDIPGENLFGLMNHGQPVFCDQVVRYVGDHPSTDNRGGRSAGASCFGGHRGRN